jgi:hypothetical protein
MLTGWLSSVGVESAHPPLKLHKLSDPISDTSRPTVSAIVLPRTTPFRRNHADG